VTDLPGEEEQAGSCRGKKRDLQTIVEPQRVCSYRWAFSAPLVQKNLLFSPRFFATGQVGHMHPFSSEMHMKLFPVEQKKDSLAFFAQALWLGQDGQVHIDLFISIIFILSSWGISFNFFIIVSKVSIG
jgi:hypothetical protein